MAKTMGAAEFKTHCLRIIDEVERSGEPVTVTKRGRPVVQIQPSRSAETERRPFVGCMTGSVTILGDITEPAWDGPWNAERGEDGDDPGVGGT